MPDVDSLRPPENNQRIKSSWTNEEQLLAVQGILNFYFDLSNIFLAKTFTESRFHIFRGLFAYALHSLQIRMGCRHSRRALYSLHTSRIRRTSYMEFTCYGCKK